MQTRTLSPQQVRGRIVAGVRLATALLLTLPLLLGTVAATTRATAASSPVSITWLRVDSRHPTTLYVGGTQRCGQAPPGALPRCPDVWAARSTDGGLTWAQLTGPLTAVLDCSDGRLDPFIVAGDGTHLYAQFRQDCAPGDPHGSAVGILRSADRGAHWTVSGDHDASGSWFSLLATSPLTPRRLYAVGFGDCAGCDTVEISNDAGVSWQYAGYAVPSGTPDADLPRYYVLSLVPDPVQPNTLYANYSTNGEPFTGHPTLVTRSTTLGNSWDSITWTKVITPAASPPLHTFAVGTDPREPGLLVGRTFDPGVPANRRYLSSDQGRTWRVATCPGTHGG
jgi:hypothetical protein